MLSLALLQVWAYGGSLVALWFTGKKSPLGPLLGIVGFLPWSFLALHSGLWPMIGYNLILTSVNARNWWLWSRSR